MTDRPLPESVSGDVLVRLSRVIQARRSADPGESYVASLVQGDESKALKKIGEESVELVLALRDADEAAMVHEAADLWFHTLVALGRHGVGADLVLSELERRFGVSGHDEKASRKK
jgi:phosphoribosyl-ATP pyrophosphohydrolase